MKKNIVVISSIMLIVGFGLAYYFSNKLDDIGTYELFYYAYMLISQGVCGLRLIGIVVGLTAKASDVECIMCQGFEPQLTSMDFNFQRMG
ncbi:MAG: hypothetical protein ACKVI6_04975 [Candidatus Poseidoniales archaeon]